jgi:hypothetical protein
MTCHGAAMSVPAPPGQTSAEGLVKTAGDLDQWGDWSGRLETSQGSGVCERSDGSRRRFDPGWRGGSV